MVIKSIVARTYIHDHARYNNASIDGITAVPFIQGVNARTAAGDTRKLELKLRLRPSTTERNRRDVFVLNLHHLLGRRRLRPLNV